ncbi:MAG: alpha/beta hydrolase [Gemmatimonadetes bacterium]|nr:alpha/beta hydrolase [Gemmatimonadota bacterium]
MTTDARARFAAMRRAYPPPPALAGATVRVRGLDFAVFRSPAVAGATPLLCINGGVVYDHRLLWPALSPLAAARQLVFYDQRGRGKSAPPPGVRGARVEHDALDVGALREALGIARWDVLGHSWGGGVALLAVADDRAGTRRLVTVDAVGPTSAWRDGFEARAFTRLDAAQRTRLEQAIVALERDDNVAALSEYNRAIYPAWFADPALGALLQPPRATSVTGYAVHRRMRTDGYDWRDHVRGLDLPVLLVHGEQDLLPPSVADEWAALLPAARVARIADAGHNPFWEQPGAFFPLVESFLASP